MVEEALKQCGSGDGEEGGDHDNKDVPLRVDMRSDPIVQLAATDPVRIPPLPPQLVRVDVDMYVCFHFSFRMVMSIYPFPTPHHSHHQVAGIGRESCVWFNAFAGRVYRDACASPLFRDWMADSFSQQLNKVGKREGGMRE